MRRGVDRYPRARSGGQSPRSSQRGLDSQTGIFFGGFTGAIPTNRGVISDNDISQTLVFDGIAVFNGNNNLVRGNDVTDSDQAGVFLIGDDNTCARIVSTKRPSGSGTLPATTTVFVTGSRRNVFFNVQANVVGPGPVLPFRAARATAAASAPTVVPSR